MNGSEARDFILDTGAGTTVLTTEMAALGQPAQLTFEIDVAGLDVDSSFEVTVYGD